MIPKPLAVGIVCLVTLVWVGSFVAQFIVADYHQDGWLSPIFFSVVGGAILATRKGSKGDPPAGGVAPPDPPSINPLDLLSGGAPPPPPPVPDPPAPPPDPPRPGGAHRARIVPTRWRAAT